LYDHMPATLRDEIYAWLETNAKDERKSSDTDEQFYYKTRKKALGPFKRDIWDIPESVKSELATAYDATFGFLFEQLRVSNTADTVARFVKAPTMHRAPGAPVAVHAAPDDAEAGE